jgi:hypothetical protein
MKFQRQAIQRQFPIYFESGREKVTFLDDASRYILLEIEKLTKSEARIQEKRGTANELIYQKNNRNTKYKRIYFSKGEAKCSRNNIRVTSFDIQKKS